MGTAPFPDPKVPPVFRARATFLVAETGTVLEPFLFATGPPVVPLSLGEVPALGVLALVSKDFLVVPAPTPGIIPCFARQRARALCVVVVVAGCCCHQRLRSEHDEKKEESVYQPCERNGRCHRVGLIMFLLEATTET